MAAIWLENGSQSGPQAENGSIVETLGSVLVGALLAVMPAASGAADTLFSGGIHAAAKEPQAARALMQFLASPAAAPVLRAKGMEPAR